MLLLLLLLLLFVSGYSGSLYISNVWIGISSGGLRFCGLDTPSLHRTQSLSVCLPLSVCRSVCLSLSLYVCACLSLSVGLGMSVSVCVCLSHPLSIKNRSIIQSAPVCLSLFLSFSLLAY